MTKSRRRQRSVRIAVATSLLAVAALVVVPSIIIASVPLLIASSIIAILAGFLALRIMRNEILQTRRDWAADRATQAQSYQKLAASRQAEHDSFATTMTKRLTDRDDTILGLRGTLRLSERRADQAERRAREQADRVATLQTTVDELTAEQEDVVEVPPSWDGADLPTIVDLMSWEPDTATLAVEPEISERKQA